MKLFRNSSILIGFILPFSIILGVNICYSAKIYDNLIECYRGNNTEQFTPNSIQILLELIRKIENKNPTDLRTLSVSLIHRLRIDGIQKTNGVPERDSILPYSPNGFMSAKFDILLKLISNTIGEINFDEVLTLNELCTLHRLISSSIDSTARGDESKTCTLNNKREYLRSKVQVYENGQFYVISDDVSRCPIENGVIRTSNYGTLSPGTVIASIAAGLQPQMIPIREFISEQIKNSPYENLETMEKRDTEIKIRKLLRSLNTIDNTYAAGLAGDLAEVCIYQAPYLQSNVSVGLMGRWNDFDYPLYYYLNESHFLHWQLTDSEILAGIDGKYLSEHILSWFNRVRRMRLSQVLEMYYSDRGIPSFAIENANRGDRRSGSRIANYNSPGGLSLSINNENDLSNIHDRDAFFDMERYAIRHVDSACNRKQSLDHIPKGKLKEQTYFMAQILQFSTSSMAVTDDLIRSACNCVCDRFFQYAQTLQLSNCLNTLHFRRPQIDLTLIIDGTRSKQDALKLISHLTEIADVSSFGSYISVIHGGSGEYLVSRTNSVMETFEQLHNFTDLYPTSLSLSKCFSTILQTFDAQSQKERDKRLMGGISNVVLVISQSQKIREDDFINVKNMLEGSFKQFPDLYFIFLTNDVSTFKTMTEVASIKLPINNKQYKIIEATDINPKTFSNELATSLRSIPKWLTIPDCRPANADRQDINLIRLEYEDYLTPNEAIYYHINSYYFKNLPEIRVQFQEFGYGSLTACQTRNTKDFQCQSSGVVETIWFNITNPCDSIYNENGNDYCPNIIFKVELDSSNMKCSENDCRYPDQVRFSIRLHNSECDNNSVGLCLISHILLLLSFVICNIFVKFLN